MEGRKVVDGSINACIILVFLASGGWLKCGVST